MQNYRDIIEKLYSLVDCQIQYIVDMGPEGGERGGLIIAEGTPEEIAKNSKSLTGIYLKDELKN